MARRLDVLCLGKTTIDQFLILSELTLKYHLDPKTGFLSFKHGEKIDVEEFSFCVGGNATNAAVGLSRLGLKAGLCSEIGDDELASKIKAELDKENIDRSFMVKTKNAASSFSVIINYKGERTIFMQRMKRDHNFVFEDVDTNYLFLTSLEKEWMKPYKRTLDFVKKKKLKLAFNPGTLQLRDGRDIVLQIIEHTDLFFVNKEEAEELVFGHLNRHSHNNIKYIGELMVKLQNMGAKNVVVTNGRYGSHALDSEGNYYHEGLFPGEVVERTGAGDAYTTGFLAATVYGKPINECMRWGAVNASSVVEHIGATKGLLTKPALEKVSKEREMTPVVERRHFHHIVGEAISKRFRLKY